MRARILIAAAVLSVTALSSASALAYGTSTDALSSSSEAWYWGNWFINNDCLHGNPTCGPGPQSSSTPYSSASGSPFLGGASATTAARGGWGVPGGQSPNLWTSDAFVDAQWWDTFTLNSSTLPWGTPVTINLGILFNAVGFGLTNSWYNSAGFAYGGPGGRLFGVRQGYQGLGGASVSGMFTGTIIQNVGQTFTLFGITRSSAGSNDSKGYLPAAGTSNGATVDADYFVLTLPPLQATHRSENPGDEDGSSRVKRAASWSHSRPFGAPDGLASGVRGMHEGGGELGASVNAAPHPLMRAFPGSYIGASDATARTRFAPTSTSHVPASIHA